MQSTDWCFEYFDSTDSEEEKLLDAAERFKRLSQATTAFCVWPEAAAAGIAYSAVQVSKSVLFHNKTFDDAVQASVREPYCIWEVSWPLGSPDATLILGCMTGHHVAALINGVLFEVKAQSKSHNNTKLRVGIHPAKARDKEGEFRYLKKSFEDLSYCSFQLIGGIKSNKNPIEFSEAYVRGKTYYLTGKSLVGGLTGPVGGVNCQDYVHDLAVYVCGSDAEYGLSARSGLNCLPDYTKKGMHLAEKHTGVAGVGLVGIASAFGAAPVVAGGAVVVSLLAVGRNSLDADNIQSKRAEWAAKKQFKCSNQHSLTPYSTMFFISGQFECSVCGRASLKTDSTYQCKKCPKVFYACE